MSCNHDGLLVSFQNSFTFPQDIIRYPMVDIRLTLQHLISLSLDHYYLDLGFNREDDPHQTYLVSVFGS